MKNEIILPEPRYKSSLGIGEAILKRRSVREFADTKILPEELSDILWAAQGITGEHGGVKHRSVPSAGALYPMEIYAVTEEGVFHYLPENHCIEKIKDGDRRKELKDASLGQGFILQAPLNIVITAVFERTKSRYAKRGTRYVFIEAGHVSQNVYLLCESLDLGTVAVGAFNDDAVKRVLGLPENHMPIYVMPVGHKL